MMGAAETKNTIDSVFATLRDRFFFVPWWFTLAEAQGRLAHHRQARWYPGSAP